MTRASDWRPAIASALAQEWPDFAGGASWIEAQVQAESAGDPHAVSPSGAQGLLQLMPATGREVGLLHPFQPDENLRAGVRYLRRQHEALAEVPPAARICWALAAYNGGLGYAKRALALAKWDWGLSREGERPASPFYWADASRYLMHRDCYVRNSVGLKRWPDYRQIWNYVARIRAQQVLVARQLAPPKGGV